MLQNWSKGDENALSELMPLVYDELRRQAARYLRKERADHTLQPTALANEAYLRLIDQKHVSWQNRAHFFGIAAQLMRRILVDHARKGHAEKRGGAAAKLPLDEAIGVPDEREQRDVDLLALDRALSQLAEVDERQSRIVELRYFGGLKIEEVAEVLGISPTTVKRELNFAKAWLHLQLSGK